MALGGGLSTRLSPRVEQLEDRRLLSVSWVDDPGDLNIVADYAGDWFVQVDQGTPDILDEGDTVTWQKDVPGKEQSGLIWNDNAFGAIQDAIDEAGTTEVNVASGTYSASLGITSRSLSIIGDSAATTIVEDIEDGGFDGITIMGGATDIASISGLTITQSQTAVNVLGASVSVIDCILSNSTFGARVYGNGTLNISDSDLTGNDIGVSVGSSASGSSGVANITGSDLTGNTTAISVQKYGMVDVSGSNLSGYASANALKVSTSNSSTMDASGNYWGTVSESAIEGMVTAGKVDFTPYLADVAAIQPDTGFAGDLSDVYVTTKGEQTVGGRIQEGVDLVADGGTVNVLAGVYHETINIVDRDDLIILGQDRDTTILQPTSTLAWDMGGYGSSRQTPVRVVNSSGITLQNMTFDYDLVKANFVFAMMGWDSELTLAGNLLENMSVPDSAGGYYDLGVYLKAPGFTDADRAQVSITGNVLKDMGRVGIVTHDYIEAAISDNTIYKTTADFGYAIEMGSMSTGVISGNTIYGYNTPAASDGSESAGIYIENCFTDGISTAITKNVEVAGNILYGNQYGLWIGNDYAGYAGNVDIAVDLHDNTIRDNAEAGVYITDADGSLGSSVSVTATDNTITDNGDAGILVADQPLGTIAVSVLGGAIAGHAVGLDAQSGSVNVSGSNIHDNLTGIRLLGGNTASLSGNTMSDNVDQLVFDAATNVTTSTQPVAVPIDTAALQQILDDNTLDQATYITQSGGALRTESVGGQDLIFVRSSIQDSIAAATAGDTVNVEDGLYVTPSQVVIDKNLSILGEGRDTTVVNPGFDTGSSGDPRGWFLIQPGKVFNLGSLTLDGDGHNVHQAVRHLGTGSINDVAFTNISYPGYNGTAVAAMGGVGAIDVSNSIFTDIGRIGVIYFGAGTTGTFSGNTYTGKGAVDRLDYAVEVGGSAHAAIAGNTITNNVGVASSDGSTSAGILVTTYFGAGTQATITNNFINGNSEGVAVGYDGNDTSAVTIFNNDLSGNVSGAVGSTSPLVNASGNWFGTADAAGVAAMVSANVDYTPWLNSAADMSAAPGFQGDFSYLNVDDDSPQVGSVGRIQEAIDMVDGSTVYVNAGTYLEAVHLNKGGLSLIGSGEGTTVIDYKAQTGINNAGMYIDADDVTVQDLTVTRSVAGSTPRYGLKVGARDGATIDGVTVSNAYRTGLDVLGATDLTVNDVTLLDNGGHGMQLLDVAGAAISNLTVSGSGWNDVSVATLGHYSPLGVSGVVFSGANSFGGQATDNGGLQLEEGNYADPGNPEPITWSTNPTDGADVTILSADFGYALSGPSEAGTAEHYTRFYQTLAQAQSAVAGSPDHIAAHDRFIRTTNGLSEQTLYYVYDVVGDTMSIQAAIDDAKAGDTIHIEAGVYVTPSQIVVNKDLTIIGAGMGATVVQPGFDTGNGSSGDARGWWLVDDGASLALSELTLDGSGHDVAIALLHTGGGGTIDRVAFENIARSNPAEYYGRGVAVYSGNVDITGSTFENIGRIGAFYFGPGVTGAYQGNTYTGKGEGDWLDYGVELGNGAQVTIGGSGVGEGNTITGSLGVASVDGSTSAGVLVTTYFGPGTAATIVGNQIYGNTTGIAVGYDDADTSLVTIDGNVFHGSGGNDTGISVVAGTAKIQNNDLMGQGVGIEVSDDALVDAGGGALGSVGNNILTGYTDGVLAGNYAIRNLNLTVAEGGAGIGVSAQNNQFGPYVDPSMIENYLYDDSDEPFTSTAIDFSNAQGQVAPFSTVYVDDDWATVAMGADPDGAGPATIMGVDAFATIADGVAAVDTTGLGGGTVYVMAGTYAGNVQVNKSNLSILGDLGDAVPGPGVDAPLVDGQSLPGSGFFIGNGVHDATIAGFEIANFSSNSNGVGNAISAWEDTTDHITIQDNLMHDLGWNGVLVGNDGATGDHTYWTISGNILRDYGPDSIGDWSGYGLELTNASHSVIENNLITADTGGALNVPAAGILVVARRNESDITIRGNEVYGEMGVGIYIQAWDEETPNVTLDDVQIENNLLAGTSLYYDVCLYDIETGRITGVTMSDNSLAVLSNSTHAVVDAVGNWWGSANGPANASNTFNVGSQGGPIYGSANYVRWLDSGVDDEPSTPGFQPAGGLFAPISNSEGEYYSSIQAAVDGTDAGGTVSIGDGVYQESNIVIDHSLTIDGQSQENVILAPSIADDHNNSTYGGTISNAFVIASSDVTIQDMTIDGNANAGLTGDHLFRHAIITDSALSVFSGIVAQNLTIENIYRKGIGLYSTGGHSTDNQVIDCEFDYVGDTSPAFEGTFAVAAFGADVEITGNHITHSAAGIGTNYFDSDYKPQATITDNSFTLPVTSGMKAIAFDLSGLAAGSTVGGAGELANTIDMTGGTDADIGVVLQYIHGGGDVLLTGNSITVAGGDTGVMVYWTEPDSVTISDNVISGGGAGTGVIVTSDSIFGDGPDSGPAHAALAGNSIGGFGAGVSVHGTGAKSVSALIGGTASNTIETASGGTGILVEGANASATIVDNDSSISGAAVGIDINGGSAVITGNSIHDNVIGVRIINNGTGTVAGNTFADNSVKQFDGDATTLGLTADTLINNTFDRAVTVGSSEDPADISVPAIFSTIQGGINAASSGDTVNALAGTYTEQLQIAKPLTVNGADGAVLDGTGLAPLWTTGVKIRSGNVTFNNIDVTNFTQDGITAYDNIDMPNLHITNCKVSNIQPGYWGFGIYVGYESEGFGYTPPDLTTHLDFSGLLIENNEITNTHSSALVVQAVTGTPGTLQVRNNYIHDNTTNSGIWIDCARNLLVQDNIVTGNKWGIELTAYAEAAGTMDGLYSPKDVTIEGNVVHDNTYQGIVLYEAWPSTIEIHNNSIQGNGTALENMLAGTVDASGNWWGSNVEADITAKIIGSVDYTPWLNVGTDTEDGLEGRPDTPGFQGDFSYLNVSADSPQTPSSLGRIQEAIDLVSDSTVYVNSGTYNESILFGASYDKADVRILGDAADRPQITGGVRFINTQPIDGVTLENLVLSGDAAGDNKNAVIVIQHNTAAVNDFSLINSVIDGGNVSDRHGLIGNLMGGSLTVTGTEFKDILGWSLLDIDTSSDYSPWGDNGLPLSNITFSDNYIHDSNGSVSLRGNWLDKTDTVTVLNNRITNIGGNEGEVGQQWAAIEVNHAENVTIANNEITGVHLGEYGEGQALQLWDLDNVDIHNNILANNYQGIWIYGGSMGGAYGGPWAIPAGNIYDNDLSGNTDYGLKIESTATGTSLNAAGNWWGSVNGPANDGNTFNVGSQGVVVGDRVNFVRWLDSGVDDEPGTLGFQPAGGLFAPISNSEGEYYSSIQAAVDGTDAGGTVFVGNGIYRESNIVIDHALTIDGESRGGVVLAPAGEDDNLANRWSGALQQGFIIQSSGVTIQDLTIDGEANPSLTPDKNNFRVGIATDDRLTASYDNLTIQNVTVQHAYFYGISNRNTGSNMLITNNRVEDVAYGAYPSYGILSFADGEISHNEVYQGGYRAIGSANANVVIEENEAWVWDSDPLYGGEGVYVYSYDDAAASITVRANTIHMNGDTIGGAAMNLVGLTDTTTIGGTGPSDGNIIHLETGTAADIGILNWWNVGQPLIQNNVIHAAGGDTGVFLFHNEAAVEAPIVRGNVLDASASDGATAGQGTGIFVTDDGTFMGDENGTNYAVIEGNSITGFVRGIDLYQNAATPVGGRTIHAEITNDNVIVGDGSVGSVGIRVYEADSSGMRVEAVITDNSASIHGFETGVLVDGGSATITGNSIHDNVIGVRIINNGTGTVTGNTFADNSVKQFDGDATTLGLTAGILTNNTFDRAVTVGSSEDPADISVPAIFSTIQGGVDVATDGDTVNVEAGVYAENVVVAKSVELAGAGQGLTTVVPSFVGYNPGGGGSLPAGSSNVVLIEADDVEIHDMTIDGNNVLLSGGMEIGGANVDARNGIIENYPAGVFYGLYVHDVTVQNIYLRGLYASSGGTFNFTDNVVDNVQGESQSIGIFNFGGSGIIQGNHVSNANDAIAANWSGGTQFLDNIVTGSGSGVHTDNAQGADLIEGNQVSDSALYGYGIWTFNPSVSPTVTGNVITNVDVALCASGGSGVVANFIGNTVDGQGKAGSTGIYITTSLFGWGDADVAVSLQNNLIGNVADGVYVEETAGKTAAVALFDNSVVGSDSNVYNLGSHVVDGSGNWWGSNVEADVTAKIVGGVDYTPWLNSGADTSADPGFQGDFSYLNVDDDSPQTGSVGRIQEAINLVSGSTVYVNAGVYNENLVVNKRLTIEGAGSGDTAADTIINASGGIGVTLTAGGNSAIDRLVLKDLRVQNGVHGIYTDSTIAHITLDNVASVGNTTQGIELHNSSNVTDLVLNDVLLTGNTTGMRVRGQLDGLTVTGGSFSGNTYGLSSWAAVGEANQFTNVSITGTLFNNNSSKGMYLEKLDHATFDAITVDASGTAGSWAAGIDINLKYAAYSDIIIQNSTITNSGTGDALNGVGLTVKARDDGSYGGTKAATLANVTIRNNFIEDNQAGVRLGEPGKNNAGPTNVLITENSIVGNVLAGLDNQSQAMPDASGNWWGSANGPTTDLNTWSGVPKGDAVIGDAIIAPWLTDGADTSADPGFQPVGLDTTPPAVSDPDMTDASDTGVSQIDNATNDNTPEFTGTAEAGATVTLMEGATVLGQTTALGDGSWSITSSLLADGVHNIIARATDQAGNESQSATLEVAIDTVKPTIAWGSTGANAYGWNKTDVSLSYTTDDELSGVDTSDPSSPLLFTSEGAGQTQNVTVTDVAGNSEVYTSPVVNLDKTAPTIAWGTTGANANGWNKTDVSLSYTTDDNLSGVDTSDPSSPLSFTTEGAGLTQNVTVTDLAGNSETYTSPEVNLDKTAPTITGAPDRLANGYGWYNADVTVSFTVGDALSGVDTYTSPVTLGEGADQSVLGAVTDLAGNSANYTVTGINIDKTAPTISAAMDRAADLGTGWYNIATGAPTVEYTAGDALSGLVASPVNNTFDEGYDQSHSQTVYDLAGNEATAGVTGVHVDLSRPIVDAGSDQTEDEGTSVSVGGAFTDSFSHGGHLLNWHVDASNSQTIADGDAMDFDFLPNDNGTYTATFTVTDAAGNAASDSLEVTVNNVKPVAILAEVAGNVYEEGSTLNFMASATDVGAVDMAAGFTFVWSVTKNGAAYDDGASSAGSQDYPFSFTPDDAGTYVVRLTAMDKDGAVSLEVSDTYVIGEVGPTVELTGDSDTSEMSVYTLTLGPVVDPGDIGGDAVVMYNINWGDGTAATELSESELNALGRQVTHTYADGMVPPAGTAPITTIRVDVLDNEGYWSDAGTKDILVRNVSPTASFSGSSSVNEGSTGTVAFYGQSDVSEVDRTAGYTYQYDFNNDGAFDTLVVPQSSAMVPASYLSDGPQNVTVRGRIIDKDGGYTDYTHLIQVNNVAPAVNAGPDAMVGVGMVFTQSGTFADPGSDTWTATVDYDWHDGDDDAVALTLTGKTFTLNHVYDTLGAYTVRVTVTDDNGGVSYDDVTVTVIETPFQVVDFTPNASGFDVTFNRAADLSVLNLYRGVNGGGIADVTLMGAATGAVKGSLVWDASTNTATFIKTSGVLTPDTYTVTLSSRSDGWVDTAGRLLDGDFNNTEGGDYATTFAVSSSSAPVLSLPDFARGPGQPVNVALNGTALATGLTIRISEAGGASSVDFVLDYNPALLNITDAVLAVGMPTDWQVTFNIVAIDSTHAQLSLTAWGSSSLSAGSRDLVVLTADVPDTAPYAAAEALLLHSVAVDGVAGQGDVALHKVAYFGDTTGNRHYQGNDASLISRVIVGMDTGFDAYLLADPVVIADVTGNGRLQGNDASYVSQKVVGMPRPEIPDLPDPLPGLVGGGVDPVVSIAAGIEATPGSDVTVPVNIEGPAEAGLQNFDLQFTYDTNLLNLNNADVKLAGLTASGWDLLVNVDDNRGVAFVSGWSSIPLTECVGSILSLTFHVPAGVSGTSAITVAASPNGGLNSGDLVLTPVDGSIVVTSPKTAQRSTLSRLGAIYDRVLMQMAMNNEDHASEDLDGLYSDLIGRNAPKKLKIGIVSPVDAVFAKYNR